MSIPLVRNNTKDAINTSIIAIKKNLERINSLLGLMDSGEPDLSGLATKQELEDAVTEINNTIDEVETSLTPVDAVTSGDMHSVTSNAVALSLSDKVIRKYSTSNNLLTAFTNVGITDDWYRRTIKSFCDNISSYSSGIHSLTIGGPAYGFILWKYNNTLYRIEMTSYGTYIKDRVTINNSGGDFTVTVFTANN